ncbi:MAG: sodium-dependent transporter, partial [Gemmatimonadota bacterium]|nr:sodium-dependent transporter [Gemmatimonadota bacterium]
MAGRERWGTRVGLVLAMAGNAVGLGNFLRFPAQAAQNGGGAFLIPYLVSFLLMGIPLLWVEWAIGRHGGRFGHHSAPGMFDRLGPYRWLKYVGVFGLFTNLTVAAYYCYIESWTLAYVWHSLVGTFRAVAPTDFFPAYLGMREGSIWAFPHQAFLWFLLTLALNIWILSRGLAKGIELAAKIGMPLLLVFGAILAVRGLTLGTDAPGVVQSPLAGLNFVWEPKPSGLLDPTTWLAAAGQIFFTLSVGMGSIHCYAAYVKQHQDVALNAASAGWMNEFVEVVLGGSILIPIATAYLGLEAVQAATAGGSGFSLGFLTLPTLFNNWGWFAPVAGAMWFGLLFFAGITSSLAMGQPVMAFFQDEFGVRRGRAALTFGIATLLLGALCVWLYPGGAFDEFDFWSGTFA